MLTIQSAAVGLRQGRLSPVELLEQCLARINSYEPKVRAWVLVAHEEAREQAEQRAEELRRGLWRGPLHGIPLAIKDIFDVFDWPTAAGSRLWQHSVARQDATVVARLRQAGAVLLGKTVTTQYASFDPPVTRNPWNRDRTPGGSSSGSAAAVACGMGLGALASQTGGSITRPAAYCGVAGCKPTHGRVSGHGVVPLAPSMDHVGPIARCVRDLAILLQTIAGPDGHDASCALQPVPDYLTALDQPRQPPRLGRVRGLFASKADDSVREMMDRVSFLLQESSAVVEETALPASFAEVIQWHRVVMAVEAAAFHGQRLRRHPEDYGPCIRALIEEGLACPAPDYSRALSLQKQMREEVRTCLENVDALLTPATTRPAPDTSTTGDPAFNSPWSYTGLPTVSFPVAKSADGLPLAIQLVGRPWGEDELFNVAEWCESVLAFAGGEPPLG
jgi:aspartyl-tRNA(Asn)/glutamyl-tRNA(Gln) amidotransferase subunit A